MNKPPILLALLQNFPMTFQEITDLCESNRNRCHKTLNQLIEKRLIKTSPKNWTQGQKRFFSLTRKGRNEALKEIGNAIETNFAILKNDLEKTLTQTTLNHIRQKAAFHPTLKEFEAGCIEKERVKGMLKKREQVLAPINNLFFELVKALLKTDGRLGVREDLENVKIHFKDGKPLIMCDPRNNIKSKGTVFSSDKWNCRRCKKSAFIVLGTNGLCSACWEPLEESPES